jgi:23S rRNA pseudouridine1911/1915/1917 synthase
MSEEHIEFTAEKAGERLDKTVLEQLSNRLSRAQVQNLISEGRVTVNDKPVKAGVKLKGGEIVRVSIPAVETDAPLQAEDIDLTIVYEDEHLAVIDKPAGMTVYPGTGEESGTLLAALISRYPSIAAMQAENPRGGIVHRLDKETSGLIVVAKNAEIQTALSDQFQARTVEKSYITLVEKRPQTATGRVDAPIARDPKQRKRMAVVRDGKSAITEYSILEEDLDGERALLKVQIFTGRTHQIRVHLAFIGCPVVGDRVYGYRKQRLRLKRQFLHSAELRFDHPITGERLSFESALPSGLANILEKLRLQHDH